MASYPSDYRYTKEHEWIKIDGNTGTIGITDHAQSSLGDIVYVDLPKVGTELKAHQSFGSVESVKAVSDIYSPVNGKVTAVNDELTSSPEKINSDAHASWFIKVEITDPSAADAMMDATAYEAFVKEEQH
jgi:glycine cleavage system H protein